MASNVETALREQLLDRRRKLEDAVTIPGETDYIQQLMQEVDAALERMDAGDYGLCEVCRDPIESERLLADPLLRFCLDHLTPRQRHALQQDLELASLIQTGLLPQRDIQLGGYEISYHYNPLGPVSGDYCDIVRGDAGGFYFMFGDISGKGIAASILMAQLHAIFRTLIPLDISLDDLISRANRIFCENTLSSQYATIVCAKASGTGEIELCNAGHLPPVFSSKGEVRPLEPAGLPIGMFCNQKFPKHKIRLGRSDTLILYTDGLTETQDRSGNEYGAARLSEFLLRHHQTATRELISSLVEDVAAYRAGVPRTDDLSIMALRRIG